MTDTNTFGRRTGSNQQEAFGLICRLLSWLLLPFTTGAVVWMYFTPEIALIVSAVMGIVIGVASVLEIQRVTA